MTTISVTPAAYAGIYLPTEAASYLRATFQESQRPPTSRRIHSWITSGLLARHLADVRGRERVIDFTDLISCQAIASFRAAGISLQKIREAEEYFRKHYRVDKPFARPGVLVLLPGHLRQAGGGAGCRHSWWPAYTRRPQRLGRSFAGEHLLRWRGRSCPGERMETGLPESVSGPTCSSASPAWPAHVFLRGRCGVTSRPATQSRESRGLSPQGGRR